MIWQLNELVDSTNRVKCKQNNSAGWIPARPENFKHEGFKRRIKAAWLVFTGKADAVIWPSGQ